MDQAAWQGHRSVDRWQQLYTDITQGQWGEVLARLERRDLAIEAWRSHVPQLIARGKVAIGGGPGDGDDDGADVGRLHRDDLGASGRRA